MWGMLAAIQQRIFLSCLLPKECRDRLPVVLHGRETWSLILRTKTEAVWEQGGEENIWDQDEVEAG